MDNLFKVVEKVTGREAVIAGECSVEGIRRALHGL